MAKRKKTRCAYYVGYTAAGKRVAKLCYKPTQGKHPRGWLSSAGPYGKKTATDISRGGWR